MVNKTNFAIVLLILLAAVMIVQQMLQTPNTLTIPTIQNIKPSTLDSDLTVSQQLSDYDILSNEYIIPPMP